MSSCWRGARRLSPRSSPRKAARDATAFGGTAGDSHPKAGPNYRGNIQQKELVALHKAHGIATQAWSPIGGITSYRDSAKRTFDEPVILAIGEKHGNSAAQVMLRWHLQKGVQVIPKSTKPDRIAENFDVFDFALTGDEIAQIDALDTGVRGGPEPDFITLENFGRPIPEA